MHILYLVSHRIANTNKPFIIGEELVLPASTDICGEVLEEFVALPQSFVLFVGLFLIKTWKH